jgi:hypothetical protein
VDSSPSDNLDNYFPHGEVFGESGRTGGRRTDM